MTLYPNIFRCSTWINYRLPYWSVGEHPTWADVSIVSDIVGNPNDFDFIIEYYLIISGTPSPNNIGENIITANLINPWTGDVVDVMTSVINVLEMEDCICPAVTHQCVVVME